jgi:hypothetical protein
MLILPPFESEEVLRVTFVAWSLWGCEFVASTDKEAEAEGRAIVSAGKDCHTARPALTVIGFVGTARKRMPAHRTKGDLAEQ